MSKNYKPYHNYNNYSANKPEVKVEEVVVEVTEENTPVIGETEQVEVTVEIEPTAEIESTVEIEEPVIEEPVVEPTLAPVIGVVNCPRLRVRSEADSTADNVICEIAEGTEVQVNEAESKGEFYKVITTAGAEGFCMKKFITIK